MKIKPYDGRHDAQIATLVELIQHKAAEHSYKGEWSGVTVYTLLEILRKEVDELHVAVAVGNAVEALREVGDVGVCIMMIAETLMRQRTLTPDIVADIRTKVEAEDAGCVTNVVNNVTHVTNVVNDPLEQGEELPGSMKGGLE